MNTEVIISIIAVVVVLAVLAYVVYKKDRFPVEYARPNTGPLFYYSNTKGSAGRSLPI